MASDQVMCQLCEDHPAKYEERIGYNTLMLCKGCFQEISDLINRRFRCDKPKEQKS